MNYGKENTVLIIEINNNSNIRWVTFVTHIISWQQ